MILDVFEEHCDFGLGFYLVKKRVVGVSELFGFELFVDLIVDFFKGDCACRFLLFDLD